MAWAINRHVAIPGNQEKPKKYFDRKRENALANAFMNR